MKESAIPLNFIPTKENVTQVLINIQRKAGFLKGFPPLAMWRTSQKRQWERCTAEFVPYFEQAITSDYDSSPLESLRERNIARNAVKLASLDIPKLDFDHEKKLAVFSKQDYGQRQLPNRSAKVVAVVTRETPLRTSSRAGLWSCVSGCRSTFSTSALVISHLKSDHHLPFIPENLAPLGLAVCPFCHNVFEALRGIVAHVNHCRAPKVPLTELVGGDFPRQCFVWRKQVV